MKSIGFNNFRKFKDFPNINLGDITFLVGANNAGKSTLYAALDFITQNLRHMSKGSTIMPAFRIPLWLGDYQRIHNKFTAESLKFKWEIANFLFEFEFEAHSPEDKVIDVKNFIIVDKERGLSIEIGQSSSIEWMDYDQVNYPKEWNEIIQNTMIQKTWFQNYTLDGIIAYIEDELWKEERLGAGLSEIEAMRGTFAPVYYSAIELRNLRLSQSIRVNEGRPTSKHEITYRLPLELDDEVLINETTCCTDSFLAKCIEGFSHGWETAIPVDDLPSAIQARLVSAAYALDECLTPFKLCRLSTHSLEKTVVYLPNHPMFNLIEAYIEKEERSKKYFFLQSPQTLLVEFLELFGIGKDIRTKSIGGVAYTVEVLNNNGEWFHLADMGTGTMHLMELFFFVLIHDNQREILFIEEPEQNLHPKYQSLLCDFFLLVKENLKCRYIVETHSEYLVRRSQVLVSLMGCKDEEDLKVRNPFKVFYFPEEDTPYEMGYKPNGFFEEPFGSGFFDEASKWSRQLMNPHKD